MLKRLIDWYQNRRLLKSWEALNIEEQRRLFKLKTLREVKWISKQRYELSLQSLFQECDSFDQLWTVSELIRQFEYVDSDKYVNNLSLIAKQIETVWRLDSSNTWICAVADQNRPDGSQAFVHALGPELNMDWKWAVKNNFNVVFDSGPSKGILNIILADDFIGTGAKIIGKVLRLKKRLDILIPGNEFRIYVVALSGMQFGLDNLYNQTGCASFVPIKLKKAIQDGIFENKKKLSAINSIIELEQRILEVTPWPKEKRFKEFNFGYNLSEAAYYQEGANIPNNVFPIFWKNRYEDDQSERRTLFRRSGK